MNEQERNPIEQTDSRPYGRNGGKPEGRRGGRPEGKPEGEHRGFGHRHRKQLERGQKGDELLKVNNLVVEYTSNGSIVHAVNDVSFEIRRGESLGLVGESGCGKSTIAKAILRILPDRAARIAGGEVLYRGEDLTKLPSAEMQKIRGAEIAMIFQDPMTALNPVRRIIKQVTAVIKLHNPELSKGEVEARAIRALKRVGIAPDRVRQYPHQFSGGMQQRVEIAIGLSCHPDLLLADEPTTALDVTMQAQALDLIKELMEENNTALLLITHNLGIVAEVCDNVAVIYGGEIMEYGSKREIFKDPTHPYTIGLFGALPDMDSDKESLTPIEGIMPEPSDLPDGCKFHTRCPYATEACRTAGTQEWCYTGTYTKTDTAVVCSAVNEDGKPEGPMFAADGSSVWETEPESEAAVLVRKELQADGLEAVWTLERKEDMTFTLRKKTAIPVVSLGGTHQCKCCHIDKVKEANAK